MLINQLFKYIEVFIWHYYMLLINYSKLIEWLTITLRETAILVSFFSLYFF